MPSSPYWMQTQIRPLLEADYPEVKRIYMEGIASGLATFETDAPPWESWNGNHLPVCRLVVVDTAGRISGWAALSKVSERCVYAGVAEVSIYIGVEQRGKGLGRMLLTKLIAESENAGFWTLQAGIMAENQASIRLHTACGFRTVGYREKIGQLHGVWYDTVLMERRRPAK